MISSIHSYCIRVVLGMFVSGAKIILVILLCRKHVYLISVNHSLIERESYIYIHLNRCVTDV